MLTKMVFLHRGRFPPVWTLCEGLDTTVWWRGSIETAIGSTHRTAGPLTSTGGRYPLSSLVERPLLREKVIYNLWGSLLTLVDASLLWAQNVCVSCMLTFAHVGSFFLGGGGGFRLLMILCVLIFPLLYCGCEWVGNCNNLLFSPHSWETFRDLNISTLVSSLVGD